MNGFCRYVLRTTDEESARTFYADLFGARFWGDGIDIEELPSHAAARGAPPHWLGHIGVDDVVGATLRFVEQGATRLGPAPPAGGTAARAVLRDPSGAIVALAPPGAVQRIDRVAWHLLSARDETRAFAVYAAMFGWDAIDAFDLGPRHGRHLTFSWDGRAKAAGSVADVARLPYVHPQWLFFFRTENLDESLARVRSAGGLTLPAVTAADGALVAPCDDPQGAAFALYQAV